LTLAAAAAAAATAAAAAASAGADVGCCVAARADVVAEAGDLALNDAFWRLIDHCGLGVGVIEDEDLARRGPDHKRLRLSGRDRLSLDDDRLKSRSVGHEGCDEVAAEDGLRPGFDCHEGGEQDEDLHISCG